MADDKLRISWEELNTARVEKHLHQQQALKRNRSYAAMTPQQLRREEESSTPTSIFYNAILALAVFGFLGGLLAWGGGELLHLRSDAQQQADQAMEYVDEIRQAVQTQPHSGGITPAQADAAIERIRFKFGNNPYLAIQLNDHLSPATKQQELRELAANDRWRGLLAHVIEFGLCGIFISICLSIAEPIIDRNWTAAVKNGAVGAALGLLGGLAASVVVDRVYLAVIGQQHGELRQDLARAASWATLGCFVAIAPGIIARNWRRFFIGVLGGVIGGAIGGFLLEPVSIASGSEVLGRLVAYVSIGVITGIATGVIERAVRTGWLKVVAGPIAGKQFILYRNPTYIGSAPDCQIYLFRDPSVGRRHAVLHLSKGGIELEDLPLGTPTLINGEPLERARLRDGDEINIGGTSFIFQEK